MKLRKMIQECTLILSCHRSIRGIRRLQLRKTKGRESQPLVSNQCKLCHIEEASEEMKNLIKEKGYLELKYRVSTSL